MAASKTYQYTSQEKQLGLLGRALAHPARIRILKILEEKEQIRNCDLMYSLELSKKAVHDHLNKLKDASLIKVDFKLNSYIITRTRGMETKMVDFLER
jgi:ArsR family transcriptional regulator, arsenate/arsenite/antimonite-responsive transcriptional repressor